MVFTKIQKPNDNRYMWVTSCKYNSKGKSFSIHTFIKHYANHKDHNYNKCQHSQSSDYTNVACFSDR